ncbi:hypothetical protein K7H13_13795 [Qipengyuania citrea]|uniref:hypothetical protein n=1 Tax=Qipengyuania citrea TaxID=225971 RepID=UPI001E2EAA27|nr:hypothetical protein [Qipengyuania citrea]MCD1591822.1 hypothetical protein [Qipengyuania citrea]
MTETKTKTKTARNEPLFAFPAPAETKAVSLDRDTINFFHQPHHSESECDDVDLVGPVFLVGTLEDITFGAGCTNLIGHPEATACAAKRLQMANKLSAPYALVLRDRADGLVDVFIQFTADTDHLTYYFNFGPAVGGSE